MKKDKFIVNEIHGDMSQDKRLFIIKDFKNILPGKNMEFNKYFKPQTKAALDNVRYETLTDVFVNIVVTFTDFAEDVGTNTVRF